MNSLDTQWILTDARRRFPGIPFIGIYQAFWERPGSKRRMNRQGNLSEPEIREQMEDFVREGASGLIAYGLLPNGADLMGWNSAPHLIEAMKKISEEISCTGGIHLGREPAVISQRRIQPRGFYRHPIDIPGMVPAWYVIGPFDASSGSLDTSFGPDEEINLDAIYPGKGIDAHWKKYQAYAGTIGLVEIYGHVEYVKECMAYASCTVRTDRNRHLQMRFSSDDDGLVRIDGVDLWRHKGRRGVHLDSDIVDITLKKGESRILVKVFNREGQWGFFLRFTETDGSPARDLYFSPGQE